MSRHRTGWERAVREHPGLVDEIVSSLRPLLLLWVRAAEPELRPGYRVCIVFLTLRWYRENMAAAEDMLFRDMVFNATGLVFPDPYP